MSQDNVGRLKARITELEEEISQREEDLSHFRQELTDANRRLEVLISELNQELKVVHQMQKHLIPTELPNIQGFDFSSKFVPSFNRGGDYFDIFEHEDRSRFGIIAASSSGHVMSAMLLSVLLKFTGRMESRRGPEPHTMLKRIADELLAGIHKGDSADIFYSTFDRRNYSLSFAKAGDLTALHYDADAAELKLLKSGHGAITDGVSTEFKSHTVVLNPRDKLILCTRGVSEAQNLDGKEFGQDQLFKAILEYATRGVHDLRNQILYQVQKFAGGQETPRDMTVVVAEVKDRVIKLAKK